MAIARLFCISLITAGTVFSQAVQNRLSFEVASIKLNTTNGQFDPVPHRSGARVTMHNTQIYYMVTYAYHVTFPPPELSHALQLPAGWNWYDIEATMTGTPTDEEVRLTFQSLLEDRFKLKVHREMKVVPSYDLVVARGGPKLKAAKPDADISILGLQIPAYVAITGPTPDAAHLVGKSASVEQLASAMGSELQAPVIDRTGITGKFDLNVLFSRNDTADAIAPNLASAIQQDLGLRLEAKKQPIEVLVADHVEKPSPN